MPYFPGRELKTYAVSISKEKLEVGEVYFTVVFWDDRMTIPEMETLVYVGETTSDQQALRRKKIVDGGGVFLFRTIEDHMAGTQGTELVLTQDELAGVYEFEAAIDVLLHCQLARKSNERRGGA